MIPAAGFGRVYIFQHFVFYNSKNSKLTTKKEIGRCYLKYMNDRRNIGTKGEVLALSHLEQQGYQLVERNYRIGRGEIDLLVVRDGMLVFVEVKTSTRSRYTLVEEKVSWYQLKKIKETAYRYLSNCQWNGNIRFDVVVVDLELPVAIQHYPGYFD